ncbi:MAG: ribosomal subunit interface protein [Candidatus Rokubacteria bacterium 13_1_40CM_4_69_5]|nr:MAG: ribosomal subunit interface protein [Candidatus Rokubacteria bacterium 13_1_40CM_4_69_5]
MQVIISGRGVLLTPGFKALVERKVTKLARVLPKVLDARVVCAAEKFRRTARLTLRAQRRTFSSEATAGDLVTAVDDAVEALGRQVREDKDRRRQHKGRAGRPRTPSRPPTGADAGAGPDLVPRRLVAKPMSVEEAVMQLGLRDGQFLVFRNAETSDVNVLSRRRNGGLGLIEPVA